MASSQSINHAKWIWVTNYDDSIDPGRFVLFRKSFTLKELPAEPSKVRVSADTRYRMFVNGQRASFGPCKSYPTRWYYETVDITPFLKVGNNAIAIRVLRFSGAHTGNTSMMRANIPGLVFQGTVGGTVLDTDTSWRAAIDKSTEIVPRSEWNFALGPPFMSLNERCDGRLAEPGWAEADFDSQHWQPAALISAQSSMMPILEPRKLNQRPIPALPEIEAHFQSAVKSDGVVSIAKWNQFLQKESSVIIPAGNTAVVELQSEVLTTGFLTLNCTSSAGNSINIMCAESYERKHNPPTPRGFGTQRWKGNRTDSENGVLYGTDDMYTTAEGSNEYEPFWFRTFRFVRLTIAAHQGPVTLTSLRFRETHYPLEINTTLRKSQGLDDMWKISLNTLRNCMHETYEDCPFYEQNQFLMDTRIQILFTYQLSRDDRLARKCIQEFYASRCEDGLLETNFPTSFRGYIIPQFSLYWILMIHDHVKYFGDPALVRKYIGTVDGILDHFLSRRESRGLVGRFDEEKWPYVDWVKEWLRPGGIQGMGIPPCYHEGDGVVTYNSLIVALALQYAADLNTFIGRPEVANEYRLKADGLNTAVNKHCFDGEMYVDGPSTKARCQHSQIFAILSGAVSGQEAESLMRKTLEAPSLPKCTYAMSFYVLRAAAKVGVYQEYFSRLMQPWKTMIRNNLSTWAEDDVMFRSDCHGWSASPIYEIVYEIFGIGPANDCYETILIEPRFELQESAEGSFTIKDGVVHLAWEKDSGFIVRPSQDIQADVIIKQQKISCKISAGEAKIFQYV